MRQIMLAAAILGGMTNHVFSADAAEPIAVVDGPEAYDWSGIYLGVQGGYAWGSTDFGYVGSSFPAEDYDINGGFLGGSVAARWQHNRAITIGVEAEANLAEVEGRELLVFPPVVESRDSDINWFGSLNAELGFVLDRWLIYGTGGVAVADIDYRFSLTNGNGGINYVDSAQTVGWTVGIGIDYALTDKIMLGARYRYYDFGNETFDEVIQGNWSSTPRSIGTEFGATSFKASYKF